MRISGCNFLVVRITILSIKHAARWQIYNIDAFIVSLTAFLFSRKPFVQLKKPKWGVFETYFDVEDRDGFVSRRDWLSPGILEGKRWDIYKSESWYVVGYQT